MLMFEVTTRSLAAARNDTLFEAARKEQDTHRVGARMNKYGREIAEENTDAP